VLEEQLLRLKAAHDAAAYNAWLTEKVSASRQGLADGTNARIDSSEWEQVRASKRLVSGVFS